MAKKSYSVEATFEGKDKVSPVMKKVGGGMGKMMTTAAAMGVAFIGVQKAVQAFGAALSKVQSTMKEAVKLAGEQERVEVKLAQAMKAAGIYTKEAFEANLKMASSFQKMTVYGDEAVIAVQSVLASMGGLSGPIMKDAVEATMNLAATWDMAFSAAAMQIAKAAGGYTSSLTRYGVMLDKAIPASEKFAAALDIINTKMGGAAQAQADTYTGKVTQLKNAWGDLLEKFGDFITKSPEVRASMDILKMMLEDLGRSAENSTTAISNLIGLIVETGTRVLLNMAETASTLAMAIGNVAGGLAIVRPGFADVAASMIDVQVQTAILVPHLEEYRRVWEEIVEKYRAAAGAGEEVAAGMAAMSGTARASLDGLSGGLDEFAESWANMIPEDEGPTERMIQQMEMWTAHYNDIMSMVDSYFHVIGNTVRRVADRMVDAMWDTKTKFKDIWKSMVKDFVNVLVRKMLDAFYAMLAKMAAKWASMAFLRFLGGVSGGGGGFPLGDWLIGGPTYARLGGIVKRFAAGGHTGLGIDSVPAMLVPGEWVVPRPAVQKHRPFLEDITKEARRGYAAGGQVQPSAPAINIVINTLDTQGAVDSLRYGEFGRALQEAMNRGYYDIPGESLV